MITPPLDASGGIGRLASNEIAEVQRTGQATVTHFDSRGRGPGWASVFQLLRALRALKKSLRTRSVDGVHINLSSRGSTVRKLIAMGSCQRSKTRYVVHLHGSAFDDFYASSSPLLRRAIRHGLRNAETVLALGEFWRDFLVRIVGVSDRRVVILSNATPGPAVVARNERADSEPLRVVFLGEVGTRKGVFSLVAAVARLAAEGLPIRLDVAGNGQVAELKRHVDAAGIASLVVIHGWVDPAGVNELLSAAHTLVLPSSGENQPLAIIEALAHGVPVVATTVGAIPEIVRDNENGLLLDSQSEVGIAKALHKLYDDDFRLAMSAAARQDWAGRLSIDVHARQLVAVWRRAFDESEA